MNNSKFNLSIKKISYIIVCLWLLVLSVLSLQNLSHITRLSITPFITEQKAQNQLIETRLSQLSEMLMAFNSQSAPFVLQSQLTDIQQELRERVDLLSHALSGFVAQHELLNIEQQLQQLQQKIEQLQAAKAAPPSTPAQTTTAVVNTKTVPPFKVLSVELRGGEQFLSIMPTEEKSIVSAVLLRAGQSYQGWQLDAIKGHVAVFKIGKQTRQFPIP